MVLDHTKALITLGLYRQYQNKMIAYGDGERLVRSYKHLMLWCKGFSLSNYSTGLLETQYQAQSLPPAQYTSLVWNRFVNNHGRADSNVPIDLDVEHKNLTLKQSLKTYRGEYTQQALDKTTQAGNIRDVICKKLAKDTGHYTTYRKKTPDTSDIVLLYKTLSTNRLYHNIPGRVFKHINIPRNVLAVDRCKAESWAQQYIRTWNSKHNYRHLRGELN